MDGWDGVCFEFELIECRVRVDFYRANLEVVGF